MIPYQLSIHKYICFLIGSFQNKDKLFDRQSVPPLSRLSCTSLFPGNNRGFHLLHLLHSKYEEWKRQSNRTHQSQQWTRLPQRGELPTIVDRLRHTLTADRAGNNQ